VIGYGLKRDTNIANDPVNADALSFFSSRMVGWLIAELLFSSF